jgi:hypothetical protein
LRVVGLWQFPIISGFLTGVKLAGFPLPAGGRVLEDGLAGLGF